MKRAGVIGWPVSHSRSPLIHGYWLKRYGIDGSYVRQPVEPEDVANFLSTLRERGFAGCNVTLPHKQAAFAAASETRPAARAAGAANTLWFEGGRLVADNTDSAGFMRQPGRSAPRPATRWRNRLRARGRRRRARHCLRPARARRGRSAHLQPHTAIAQKPLRRISDQK